VVLSEGGFDEAAQIYEEALAYGREMGDQNAVAGRRYDLARVAWSRGDYDEAKRLYEETLAYVREFDNEAGIAGTLYDLGGVAWAQGHLGEAQTHYEASLAEARRIGARQTEGAAQLGLARVALARGSLPAAREYYREGLTLMRASPNPWGLGYALDGGAALEAAEQRLERAATLLGAAEAAYEHLRNLLAPVERDEHARTQAAARDGLGEAVFSARFAEGRAMTMEQAVAFALAG
jgi:tetratricopeptide (TPR) repeat protein